MKPSVSLFSAYEGSNFAAPGQRVILLADKRRRHACIVFATSSATINAAGSRQRLRVAADFA